MEDGHWLKQELSKTSSSVCVLILIVMEDGHWQTELDALATQAAKS